MLTPVIIPITATVAAGKRRRKRNLFLDILNNSETYPLNITIIDLEQNLNDKMVFVDDNY